MYTLTYSPCHSSGLRRLRCNKHSVKIDDLWIATASSHTCCSVESDLEVLLLRRLRSTIWDTYTIARIYRRPVIGYVSLQDRRSNISGKVSRLAETRIPWRASSFDLWLPILVCKGAYIHPDVITAFFTGYPSQHATALAAPTVSTKIPTSMCTYILSLSKIHGVLSPYPYHHDLISAVNEPCLPHKNHYVYSPISISGCMDTIKLNLPQPPHSATLPVRLLVHATSGFEKDWSTQNFHLPLS